jgi:DNA polymerase-3 subunit chi
MTQVDFYILEDGYTYSREVVVCRLVHKAFTQRHRICILTDDESHAEQLDQLLWTFSQESFIPHASLGANPDPFTPVLLGWGDLVTNETDVLINLRRSVPPCFSQFSRVIEVIPTDESVRAEGRERFRFYKDRGYPIHSHQLKNR